MKIIKRSGTETVFDITKITAAIMKANKEVPASERLSLQQIQEISDNVEQMCLDMNRSPNVEEIQDMVENQIMNTVLLHWPESISHIVIPGHLCVNQIPQMIRS